MNLSRLARIPRRIEQDLAIILLAYNWHEILKAKLTRSQLASIRLRNGVTLNSPAEVNLNFLFHEIWLDKFYAPTGYAIKPGETIVDIGANIGVFATWAATSAENVRVISFEPFPANAEYFRANLAASGLENVDFHSVAVADLDGTRTLHISDSWILHSLTAKDSEDVGIPVTCVSLNSALDGIEKCDLLKLDCEGGEYDILYSASPETVSKIGRIVCEFNVVDDETRNGTGLRDFLTAKGFRVDRFHALDSTSGFICAKRI